MSHLQKVICKDCDSQLSTKDLLEAPNPFDAGEVILGCPRCHSINSTVYACDYLDCWSEVTCGLPTNDGYRSVCGQHFRELDKPLISEGS